MNNPRSRKRGRKKIGEKVSDESIIGFRKKEHLMEWQFTLFVLNVTLGGMYEYHPGAGRRHPDHRQKHKTEMLEKRLRDSCFICAKRLGWRQGRELNRSNAGKDHLLNFWTR